MKKNSENNDNIELIALAAISNKPLSSVDIEETAENKKIWKIINASANKMYKSGIDVEIPF